MHIYVPFRFNLRNMCFHSNDFGVSCEWNFFATAHGKSVCDGIGGTVKRIIGRLSLQRITERQILTPMDMVTVAKEEIKGIK